MEGSSEGRPVIVGGAEQHDFLSQVNGRRYRIMVAPPLNADAGKTYPIVYVIDGNRYFAAAANHARHASTATRFPIPPAIVVGVGYPTDDIEEVGRRRGEEFSVTGAGGRVDFDKLNTRVDEFMRVLLQEVKPFVASRWKISENQQGIYGHSLGGLIVARVLFGHPTAFTHYIASDPTLGGAIAPAEEASFSDRAKAEHFRLRVLVIGDGPAYAALAQRLGKFEPAVNVSTARFADEDHISVSLASLSRGLSFALKPPVVPGKKI